MGNVTIHYVDAQGPRTIAGPVNFFAHVFYRLGDGTVVKAPGNTFGDRITVHALR